MKTWQGICRSYLLKPHSPQILNLTIMIMLVGLLSACGGAATQSEPAEPPAPVDEPQQVEAAQPEAAEPVAELPEAETVEPVAEVEAPVPVDPVAEEEQPLESTMESTMETEAEVEEMAQVEPTTEVEPEVVAEPPAPRPLDQLIATDPATVNLASGQVQLVELFAFW